MSSAQQRRPVLRKLPRQERSRFMVSLILDTTAQVLMSEGYEQVTTNRIAAVAGISVGSLYQYFPNKAEILRALALRHSRKMEAVLQMHFAQLGDAPLAEAARRIILAEFSAHAVEANLHRALLQEVPKPERITPECDVHQCALLLVRNYLARRFPLQSAQQLDLSAFILVHTISALSEAALRRRPGLLSDESLLTDSVALVAAYLQRLGPERDRET